MATHRPVDADAQLVYNYHRMSMPLPSHADAIFCLCSLDTRVARRAAELFLSEQSSSSKGDQDGGDDDKVKYLIFSGGSGKLTESRFDKPEAEVFADIARKMGVSDDKIIVEPRSTNTGENVRFTWALLQDREIQVKSLVLVQKPYMERRTYATFKKQWPDLGADIAVTSPQLEWEEYPDAENPRDLVVSIAVGDLIRIREYPAKGFQIEQEIPDKVWEAGQRLVAVGYDTHLP
ncbi:DUF218 domain-containing protein [Microdochium trichocladiopsis]|uniref:DUF218 domain-containing protein n=1 Tax=Microdochium trichocladiopsis TaxID=1682393 RepID=A0A9P8YIP9_9PEZI|nr:DUF218 domain-containing protein [Microdochium trichocladiopsis]KAH7041226.1 DUF218 domain-containing protein [Microdochium trichocladiopsis]